MAKMVGVWLYVAPRRATDPANCSGGATIIITEADKRKLGDGFMRVSIRVMDDDSAYDDVLYKDDSFQLGPGLLQIGPNSFTFGAAVSRKKMEDSEPPWESAAELKFRVMASGAGGAVKTSWAESQVESVRFE